MYYLGNKLQFIKGKEHYFSRGGGGRESIEQNIGDGGQGKERSSGGTCITKASTLLDAVDDEKEIARRVENMSPKSAWKRLKRKGSKKKKSGAAEKKGETTPPGKGRAHPQASVEDPQRGFHLPSSLLSQESGRKEEGQYSEGESMY